MLCRIAELKNIGENLHENCLPSNELVKLLSSFNILRGQSSNFFFSKVLVKKVAGQTNEQVFCYLSEFFDVSRYEINILKESFDKNTIVCLVKFANFNNYIQFENIVLPHNLTLLNRVNSQSRVKSSVCFSSLIVVKIGNGPVSCDSDSSKQNLVLNDLVCGQPAVDNVSALGVHSRQVPIIRQPVVCVRDCMLNLDSILANENVALNVNDVHLINRNKCPKKVKSVNVLNQFKGGFSFVSVNVQGILDACHFDELKMLLNGNSNVNSIAIVETWLRSSNTNKSIDIPGYKIIRSDRKSKSGDRNKGGGVAIFVLKNLKTKVILNSSKDNAQIENVEFLFIEIFTRTSKIIFGIVYRAPRCNAENTRKLFDLISATFSHEQNVIICGDFNINLINNSNLASILNTNFALNFDLVNDICPTHWWPGKIPSKIDLIFTNNPERVKFFGHFPSGISFHDLLLCSYNIKTEKIDKNIVISGRKFSDIDENELFDSVELLNWNFDHYQNVDLMVLTLNDNIRQLLDRFAPFKSRRVRHKPKHWFNNDIKQAMDERKAAYDNCKRNNSRDVATQQQLLDIYKEKASKVKSLINISKKKSTVESFNNANSIRSKWSVIESLGCCKSSKDDSNESEILDNFNLDDINSFFASIHSSDGADLGNLSLPININSTFSFQEITIEQFLYAFKQIKSNAVGDDGIPLKFLNLITPIIAHHIVYIFNYCIMNSFYPADWNKVIIKPLNKVTSPQSISEYRPISIISVIPKIFAILLNSQVTGYLESNAILHERQSGFRKNHSCTTSLLNISESIRSSLNRKKVVIFVSLDIKSAFPSVPHDALLKVCESYGFSNGAVRLIKSIYSNIQQKVKVGNQESNFISINNGVLQGSNFGQTFFSLYFNDMLNVLENMTGHLFADDCQALLEVDLNQINNGIDKVNSDLAKLNDFIKRRGMKLNGSKSKVMIIGTKHQTSRLNFDMINDVKIGDEKLEFCKSIKNLGVIFDENLTFLEHDKCKLQKVYGVLNRIRHTKHFIPNYVKRDMAVALIDPIMDYGNVVTYGWGAHSTQNQVHRDLVADNDKIRYIYGLKRNDHVTEYRERLNGLTPESRAKLQSAVLIFKQLSIGSPEYLNHMFIRNGESSRYPENIRVNFNPRSTFDTRAFKYAAINFWNSIPVDIRNSKSLFAFKNNLKHLLRSTQ